MFTATLSTSTVFSLIYNRISQSDIYSYFTYILLYVQWRTQEFCMGGGFNKFSWGQRTERGSGGGSPLVRGPGGSCNLVQEI